MRVFWPFSAIPPGHFPRFVVIYGTFSHNSSRARVLMRAPVYTAHYNAPARPFPISKKIKKSIWTRGVGEGRPTGPAPPRGVSLAPSGARRPARRPRARRQGRFDRLPGQPVQQLSAHVPTLCPLVAAVCCAAAQGDDPFCVVGCCCAFFQRYDVMRLQVPCGDPPFSQAQPAQLVVPPVHFSAGLLPPVGVSHSGLCCALLGTRWPARAHIATRVHAAAPLAAYLHFFTGFL